MRFSEIIGKGFFEIKLSPQQLDLLDKHFVAAAHHRYRWIEGGNKDFHNRHYYDHLNILMSIIRQGDFTNFFQHPVLIKQGFNRPDRWKITGQSLTPMDADSQLFEPTIFSEMCADWRWSNGQEHPYDVLLDFEVEKGANISLLEGFA